MASSCNDGGPWPCTETGCPSPWVTCGLLHVACGVKFSDIWQRLPSATLAGRSVADECQKTCGRCVHACELLSREVLTAAAGDDLEVQLLRFALPPRHDLRGPSAHVKVRAPDAPGQTNRVRAYSAIVDADARSFSLTVKIYPGGPPATRGTSAHLGGLRVGASLHVLEGRSLGWAEAAPARLGLIAFGVGIAECLEPAELALERGGSVALSLIHI